MLIQKFLFSMSHAFIHLRDNIRYAWWGRAEDFSPMSFAVDVSDTSCMFSHSLAKE